MPAYVARHEADPTARIQGVPIPTYSVPRAAAGWNVAQAEPPAWSWDDVAALPPFVLADGSGPALQQTQARLCCDEQHLYVRFDCSDRDIWGSYTRRDEPIYDQEAVELFLSPGAATPERYFEFELSPNGVLLDALIHNPTSNRADIRVDLSWNCTGLRWYSARDDAAMRWWAKLVVPWASLVGSDELPALWRANFYRIERQRNAEPEFSCWSPTMTEPADFHKPAYFGLLRLRVTDE